MRIEPGVRTPRPFPDFRCYPTLVDDVLDPLVSGFGSFDDG
jgi:hypothetical protein